MILTLRIINHYCAYSSDGHLLFYRRVEPAPVSNTETGEVVMVTMFCGQFRKRVRHCFDSMTGAYFALISKSLRMS